MARAARSEVIATPPATQGAERPRPRVDPHAAPSPSPARALMAQLDAALEAPEARWSARRTVTFLAVSGSAFWGGVGVLVWRLMR